MHLLLSCLFALGAGAPRSPVASDPAVPAAAPAALAAQDASYEELERSFREAERAHRAELKEARKAGNLDEVKARAPIHSFYPRFAALAGAGDGRALLWQATHVEDLLDDKAEISRSKRELFDRLAGEHASAGFAMDIAKAISLQKRWLTIEELEQLDLKLAAGTRDPEVAAQALLNLSHLLGAKKATPEQKQRAAQLRERILNEYPQTGAAAELDPEKYKAAYLAIGKVAPDFTTQDVEGVEFKLSDYRGKVVLLDFWGFW